MKGKLVKEDNKWWIVRDLGDGECMYFKLHPSDIKQIEQDAKVFDNIEARIAANPDVDFIIEDYWETGLEQIIKVARLTPYISDDFQIGPDGAYEHTED